MIEGVIATCPSCGGEVAAVGGIVHVHNEDGYTHVHWMHPVCQYQGEVRFGEDYFKARVSPALRGRIKHEGKQPLTDEEKMMNVFVFDLEGVDNVADLLLHWDYQEDVRPSSVRKEVRRG